MEGRVFEPHGGQHVLCSGLAGAEPGRLRRKVLHRKFLRCSAGSVGELDGCDRADRTRVAAGSCTPCGERQVERASAAVGHAGDPLLATARIVGLPMGRLASSGPNVPPFYDIGSHAGARRVRICAPVSAGSSVDPSAGDSRRSFENEQRLQSHLVQREKLASLGELVAGAAHEIDHPLTAIMEYSEKLWSNERLTSEQDTLVRKIVNQSQRTRELIANLLSFAQQSSGEKTMVDLGTLLQRSVQMRELQRHDQKIRIETVIEANLPRVWGDGHQLFQTFVQIVENALDALEEAGGGSLQVSAKHDRQEVIVQFSDSGPGVKEPHKVFDPFYTTKPIGKGTGLGLSAMYGVVQDHQGQITCQNKPEGGAVFVLRLPVAKEGGSQALAAVQS